MAHVTRVVQPDPFTLKQRQESIRQIEVWRKQLTPQMMKRIQHYVASQWDVTEPARLIPLALLVNLTPGPVVLKTPHAGYGLFAERDYGQEEWVTHYRGLINFCDEGPYVVDVQSRNVRTGTAKWIHIDAFYGFTLESKGRWVNENRVWNEPRNRYDYTQNVTLKWDNAEKTASFYTQSHRVSKGDAFYWYYGKAYKRSHY